MTGYSLEAGLRYTRYADGGDEVAATVGLAGPSGRLRVPALVGRDAELEVLRAELERVRAGEGLPRAEVVELCGGFLDDLGALSRAVAAARGRAPAREPPRLRLLQGIAALLGNLAGGRRLWWYWTTFTRRMPRLGSRWVT